MRTLLLAMTASALACGSGTEPTPPNGANPNAVAVVFSGGTVSAEVAATFARRETGLMNRTSIAADSGMLFVWATDRNQSTGAFHMVNTHFDLAIAFIDANKKVINVAEMMKETATLHFATAPFRYALEAPKGWFAAHGVVAGATATFTLPAGLIIDP